jgi:23S rRNA (cytosine1962-C5)-methyltransferase
VYPDALEKPQCFIEDGAVVDLFERERFLGRGFYNAQSQIRLRILTWDSQENIDQDFFDRRVEAAISLRQDLQILSSTNSMRVIFSESDGLSGLVVDAFDDVLVMQVTSLGLYRQLDSVVAALKNQLKPRAIFLKQDSILSQREGILETRDGWLWGSPIQNFWLREHDLEFKLNLESSQKTGFYLDQRENRRRVRSISRDRSVADLCCFSGGFALNAAKAGARSVMGVDSSGPALDLARENANHNGLKINFLEADVADWLNSSSDLFEVLIFDPPKLIPSQKHKKEGLKSYYRLNELALKRVQPGGYFMTFSCSGSLDFEEFQSLLQAVGRRSGRHLQLLERLQAPSDHPILLSAPSTQYLKGFLFRVLKAL